MDTLTVVRCITCYPSLYVRRFGVIIIIIITGWRRKKYDITLGKYFILLIAVSPA